MIGQDGARANGTPANRIFAGLYQILSMQAAALEQLVELGEAKKTAILEDQPEKLETIAESEMKTVRKLRQAEEQRKEIANWLETQVAKQLGKQVRITLSDLVALAPEDWKDKFELLEQRLRQASIRLEQLSDLNRRLLTHALAVVNLSLEMLTSNGTTAPVYEKSGKSGNQTDGARLVDAEA